MSKFWRFLINKDSRNEEREALKAEIEAMENELLKSKSKHRVGQNIKKAVIEKLKEKREELQHLTVSHGI